MKYFVFQNTITSEKTNNEPGDKLLTKTIKSQSKNTKSTLFIRVFIFTYYEFWSEELFEKSFKNE
jgi:hypothetical protein